MFSACPCGFQSVSVGGLVTANFPWVWMCLSVVASSRMYSHLTDRAPRIDYRIERLLKINEWMTIKAKWRPNRGITFILIVNFFLLLLNCTPLFFLTFSYTADTLATLPDSHAEPVKPLSSSLAVTLLFCGRVHTDSLRIAHIHFHSLSLSAWDEIFALNRKKEDQIRPCIMTVDFEDCLKDSPRFR